jgi:hypothetical protein
VTKLLTRDDACECTVTTGTGQKRPAKCECGNRFWTEAQLNPPERKPLAPVSKKRQAEEDSGARPKQRSTLNPGKGFEASKAQQRKVKLLPCVGCGRGEDAEGFVDPAHLIPRRWVKCEHPEGVIPLCRECHRRYDDEHLDILARLEDTGYHAEMGHFITEHKMNPLTLLRYVGGGEYVPKLQPSPTNKGSVAAPRKAA